MRSDNICIDLSKSVVVVILILLGLLLHVGIFPDMFTPSLI